MTAQLQTAPPDTGTPPQPEHVQVLELIARFCDELERQQVRYCHWKSNEAIARSMTGDNDLDLLVARADQGRFLAVLADLGFKAASLPEAREVPAVRHYYGLDARTGRFVHVHVHFRLVLGDDTTKNFWLPIEDAYLESCSDDDLFPLPAPEFELAVLVLRLVLKHATWDSILQGRGRNAANEDRELAWLQERTTWAAVDAVVAEHLPALVEVWPACRRAVEPGCPVATRVRTAARLARALAACARRPRTVDTALRLTRRVTWGTRRYVLRKPVRKRLVAGGAVVAIVGGDGSGKSTAVDGVCDWLSKAFVVRRVHVGRPPKSLTTLAVKGALVTARRVGMFADLAEPTAPPADRTRPPSVGWITWHLLTARDRNRLYRRARRVAANGGIVVCDRFPLAQLHLMDGPRTGWVIGLSGAGRLRQALARREARYYAAFTRPDVLAVLRVPPEIAVQRKTDEEPGYVHRRSTEVWQAKWDESTTIVDAGQPAPAVLAQLRTAVWAAL